MSRLSVLICLLEFRCANLQVSGVEKGTVAFPLFHHSRISKALFAAVAGICLLASVFPLTTLSDAQSLRLLYFTVYICRTQHLVGSKQKAVSGSAKGNVKT